MIDVVLRGAEHDARTGGGILAGAVAFRVFLFVVPFVFFLVAVAGFMPGPLMAAYYATKAHMLSLSEALAEELQGNGVTVTALCPGPTKTGFFGKAGGPAGAGNKRAAADPRKVAEYGFAAMNAGKRVAIFGFEEKLKVFLDRFLPRQVVARRSAAFLR